MRRVFVTLAAGLAFALSGCVNTSIQSYADRSLPSNSLRHIAAFVSAPGPLAVSMQASIAEEARKRGVLAEDALTILPPTRKYSDAEVRAALQERGVDGVLIISVADSGIVSQYAGTIFQSSSNGVMSSDGTMTQFGNTSNLSMNGTYSGTTTATATPTFRYSRQTNFSARLIDPKSARNLWIGYGEVSARGGKGIVGRLLVADGASASRSISAIFDDLQKKGVIRGDAS
jgi:hypothetical protein